jgi:hypothetical protein
MTRIPDEVESQYLRALDRHAGDSNAQHELSIGLSEYRQLFKRQNVEQPCMGCSEPQRCGVHMGDECPGWDPHLGSLIGETPHDAHR